MASRLNPDDAADVMRAAGLEPLVPYPGAREKWLCRCTTCGRDVEPAYTNVQKGCSGCRWCGRDVGAIKYRMNSAVAASALAATRGLEPLDPYPGATFPWRCRCSRCGAEVAPTYHNMKKGQGGCRVCGHAARAVKQRGPEDVAVADLQAAGFDPLDGFPGVMNPWSCRCRTCGKSVTKSLNDIRSGITGCRWCLRLIVDPVAAAEFMRSAGVEPLSAYPGSDAPWPCRCRRCQRDVSPRYGAVRGGLGACGYCGGRVSDPSEAAALMLAANLEPLEPFPGSKPAWKCRCLKCGRIVHPSHTNIKQGGGGCRWCAASGFKPGEAAVVYLIKHSAHGAIKVGIADNGGMRLKRHTAQGWQALAVVSAMGEHAMAIEKNILGWWRIGLGLPPYLGSHEMPQGGWTETVDADAIDIPATIERIKRLAEGAAAA